MAKTVTYRRRSKSGKVSTVTRRVPSPSPGTTINPQPRRHLPSKQTNRQARADVPRSGRRPRPVAPRRPARRPVRRSQSVIQRVESVGARVVRSASREIDVAAGAASRFIGSAGRTVRRTYRQVTATRTINRSGPAHQRAVIRAGRDARRSPRAAARRVFGSGARR